MLRDELWKKINLAMAGENDYLIGDIEFDKDELLELQTHFRNRAAVARSVSSFTDNDFKVFIVYIVNKLREWDKEWPGNMFWDRVSEMFENDGNVSKILRKPQLYDALADTLKTANRVVFVNDNSHNRQFAQTFLFQAFSTKESMQAFIQLAWNLYINEDLLDCDYQDSDLEFCKYIINNLKSKYSNVDSEEAIQFGGDTYNIKAALRYGIFQNDKTASLLDRIFKYIYRVDYNNEDICDNHLGILVTDKINELKQLHSKSGSRKRINKTAVRGKVDSFEKLRPQYKFNDDPNNPRVFLSFPKLMLINSENKYEFYRIHIFNNDIKINDSAYDYCYAKHNEDITIFNSIEIDITDYILEIDGDINLSIKITTNIKEEEYSSKESLRREYILFKGTNEIRGNCRQGDYFLITSSDFDINKIVLIDEDGLYSLNHCIHSINTSDGDCILGNSYKTIFGSQKKEQVQFRESPTSIDGISIVKDNIDIPIYISVSDLTIALKSDDVPNTVVVKHLFTPFESTDSVENEIRVNELPEEGIRYIYDMNEYCLNGRGYHEIQINQLTGIGSKSIILSPIRYYFDSKAKYITHNKLMYLNGNFNIDVHMFDYRYQVSTTNNSDDEYIEISDKESLKITFPYFKWQFGTFFDSVIHTSAINSNKPLFIDDIYSSSETIEIDSFFEVDKVIFKRRYKNDIELIAINNKSNTKFRLAELLQTYPEKGNFLAVLKDGRSIPLFSVTNEPYIIERLLNDCFVYENGICHIDLSNFFIHDHFDYLINISMINLDSNETIEINAINPNVAIDYENSLLVDGDYEIKMTWAKIIGGLIDDEKEISFKNTLEIQIGNPLLVKFNRIDEFFLDKTKIMVNDRLENIKFKDYAITSIDFVCYDEVGNLRFKGILKCKDFKPLTVEFVVKNYQSITQLQSNGRMFNYDYLNKKLSMSDISDDKIYQMYTLYIKILRR